MHCEIVIVMILASVASAAKMLATQPLVSHSGPNEQADVDFAAKFLARIRRSSYNREVRSSRFYSRTNSHSNNLRSLVAQHNQYRRSLGASNMEGLYWDDYLAASAQRHADRCDFWHSTDRRGVGENIWAAPWADFSGAVQMWFVEGRNCGCGCSGTNCGYFNHCCGHFTQVAWATTNRVGCGFRACSGVRGAPGQRYVLVCQYSPAGNVRGRPGYQRSGSPCSQCPTHARNCRDNLCYP